ncbi:hypothetical protein H4R18_004971 [Coemansia javaensis]|uniref:RWD domain-containing protein n=1 Tax=Coemansia javaensis TaxID=2761396 RepID=A0A9W8LGA3_9FUNG|nr:hypothetical protein H4R18_004971 [Coemansia javaensis]
MANRQRQQDEILALEAILGAAAVDRADGASFVLHVAVNAMEAQVDVRFHLPDTYPSDSPPVFEWVGARDVSAAARPQPAGFVLPARQLAFSEAMSRAAAAELHRAWAEDMCRDVVIFAWVTWLEGYLAEHWPLPLDPIPLPRDGARPDPEPSRAHPGPFSDGDGADAPPWGPFPDGGSGAVPVIYSGEPLELKKSVFLGHVARVRSVRDVELVRSTLLQNRRIAEATHNIMAYRIRLDNGSISQDNDDDGETAAGRRLAYLLQLLNAENVVVVVTRWYGGIQLGPDRFKLINNAAREALDASRLLGDQY